MAIQGNLTIFPNPITSTGLSPNKTTAICTFTGLDYQIGNELTLTLSGGDYSKSVRIIPRYAFLSESFTIQADEIGFPANSSSVTFTAVLDKAGTPLANATASVSINIPPVVSNIQVASSFSDPDVYIQGIPATVTAKIQGQYGATISSASAAIMTSDGTVTTISLTHTGNDIYSGTINGSAMDAGAIGITVTGADSRSKSGSASTEINALEHGYPTVTYEIFRCDSGGYKDFAGAYLSITAYASSNPITLGISSLTVLGLDSSTAVPVIDDGNGNPISINSGQTYVLGGTLSPDKKYSISIDATDDASTYGGTNLHIGVHYSVRPVKRVINLKDGGTGVAFGKQATTDNLLDSKWDINTEGGYYVNGDPLVDTLPDASASVRGMVSTGTQGFSGLKTFYNDVSISKTDSSYPALWFRNGANGTTPRGSIFCNIAQTGDVYRTDRFYFRQYSYNSTTGAKIEAWDQYRLPATTADLTGANNYNILTSKSPVTIEQGGTGATTLEGVREALQFLRMYTFALSSGTAKALTVPSNSRHFVVVTGTAAGRSGAFCVSATSTGSMGVLEIAKGASLSYTTSTNTLTFTASGGQATVMVISMYGNNITG